MINHNLKLAHILKIVSIVCLLTGISLFSAHPKLNAQVSCDDPPIDVSNLVQVWDLTDFCQYQDGVFDEIISGGVSRDGIPPIDDPSFDSIEEASDWLEPHSPVIALEVDGVARAYPLAIMTRHEIVNDVIADQPVAVTFCPLCNSALVFDRVVEGETMRFGVSGLLRNSDLIMWDDLTQTWWQQFTGTGLVGEYTDFQLDFLPSTVVGFGAFVEQYPEGEVLSPGSRSYGTNPYVNYDSTDQPFLFRGTSDDRLPATERVIAGVIDGQPIAYPFTSLAEKGVINDRIGEREIVVFWQPGTVSALDESDIDASREVGMAAIYRREVDGEILTFTLQADEAIHDVETGSTWNVFGTAIDGELEGTQLRQELAAPHFWFAWAAFQPETLIYYPEDGNE